MKTLIFSILSLTAGVATGFFAGFAITKKKYITLADTEVESVKKSLTEYYENKIKQISEETAKKSVKDSKEQPKKTKAASTKGIKSNVPLIDADSIDYEALKINEDDNYTYGKYTKPYKKKTMSSKNVKEETPVDNADSTNKGNIYVLSPEEFADSDYDVVTLNYYSDGVLADDCFNIIKDVKGTVGDEVFAVFGEHKTEVAYVRNENYKIDYEILLDESKYYEVAPVTKLGNFPGDDED